MSVAPFLLSVDRLGPVGKPFSGCLTPAEFGLIQDRTGPDNNKHLLDLILNQSSSLMFRLLGDTFFVDKVSNPVWGFDIRVWEESVKLNHQKHILGNM